MPVHVTSHMTISVSGTGNSQTCRTIYQGQSLLPCLGRSKGLSTRLHRVSQSHKLARPLPQVQPPSPQRAPLRLRLIKSLWQIMFMCSLVTRSCCISLETRLVLNSDYINSFLFLCVLLLSLLMFPADWLMFKQLHKRCVWRISCSVYRCTCKFAGWWPVCGCDEQKTHYWCLWSASSISFLLHWNIS